MKRAIALIFASALLLPACVTGPKSPDAIEQETSGSYKRYLDEEQTAVIITGAYNNIELPEIKNFRELIEWEDEDGNIYETDFADETSPLYIKGRNGIVYLAIRVAPGKYKLNNFMIRSSNANYSAEADFKNRYRANFEIADGEVMFVGILRTSMNLFGMDRSFPGKVTSNISTFLENGKEDLYKITGFYNAVTRKPVKTNVMYWNDSTPAKEETLLLQRKTVK